jgi:predicted permease
VPRIPGLRRAFTLPRSDRATAQAVDDEIQFHLDMLVEELVASGMTPEEARAAARRQFGDVERVRDRCQEISTRREDEMRRVEVLATIRQDLAFAARTLRKAPTFTLVALLTLALGIGASTAIYSVVQAVLLRPLPFREPDRLVRVWLANPGQQVERSDISKPDFDIWRDETKAFSSMAAYYHSASGLALTGMGEPERLSTAYVTGEFFRTLGVSAARGRVLLPEEDSIGRNRVALLSHGAWMRLFGGDPAAVGRTLTLDAEPFTIVGVARPDFRFPAEDVDLWVPRSVIPESGIPSHRWNRVYAVVGRLAPGATTAQAEAEIRTFALRIADEFPDANAGYTTVLSRPIREVIVGDVRPALLVLLAAVGLVLLVSCVNVANLQLARGTTRARELAIRTALGAGRGRIVRQLLTESLVLAAVGGALGVALAAWGARALVALSAEYLPRAADVRVDAGVLLFALALSVLTGLAFGLVPALRTTSADPQADLREGNRGSTAGAGGQRLRLGLVAAEVALAMLLVVGAGLALRSFARLTNVDPGFDAERTLVARFSLPSERFDSREARLAAYDVILERIRSLPGVAAAGMTKNAPMRGTGEQWTFTIPGRPLPRQGEEPVAMAHPVSPDYFRAMGIPLRKGAG